MHVSGSLFDDPELDDDTFEDDHPDPPLEGDDDDGEDVEVEVDPAPRATNGRSPSITAAAPAPAEIAAPTPPALPTLVPLADLRLEYKFWKNPRTVIDEAKIAEMAASIKARMVSEAEDDEGEDARVIMGVTEEIKIVAIRNALGKTDLLIIDGQRRYLGCMQVVANKPAGELVPVKYLESEPIEWTQDTADHYYVLALHGVGTREGLSAYELSENAERLREKTDPSTGKKYTLAAIAAILNRSESWVSKILTARSAASAKLTDQWRRSEITEEQFRDLASVRDKDKQDTKAKEVAAARESGRGTSRAIAKGEKLIARKEDAAARQAAPSQSQGKGKGDKAKGKDAKAAPRGPQADLPIAKPPEAKPVATERKPKPMPYPVVEDVLGLADKLPPSHDMVRGIFLGIKVATGLMDLGELPKPWQTYIMLVSKRSQNQKAQKAKAKK